MQAVYVTKQGKYTWKLIYIKYNKAKGKTRTRQGQEQEQDNIVVDKWGRKEKEYKEEEQTTDEEKEQNKKQKRQGQEMLQKTV